MKHNTTALLAQKQQSSWNPKIAIKKALAQFGIKFDAESDYIDLRTMSQNYAHMHDIIPANDIHELIVAVLGPNYTTRINSKYDPLFGNVWSPPNVPGAGPKMDYITWDQVYLYSVFQRDVSPRHIAKILKDFDHSAVIIPCAIKFTWQGKVYYCIWDGHHTMQVLKLAGYTQFPVWYIDVDQVDSKTITSAGFADDEEGRIKYGCWIAGRNMIRINSTNKRGLEHYDKFMILLNTLDAKAVKMNRIIQTTNCVINRKAKTPGSWTQINSGEECYDLLLGNGLASNGVFWQHALEFHRSVWPKAPLVLEMFRPMSYLYQAFNSGNYVIDAQFDTELENIIVSRYGDPETAQDEIKKSYNDAIINNLGRGQLLKNDTAIVMNGLINLYNQNCGRLAVLPTADYVWSV
jgi:hypothetical protein